MEACTLASLDTKQTRQSVPCTVCLHAQLTDLRFRSHELEAVAAVTGGTTVTAGAGCTATARGQPLGMGLVSGASFPDVLAARDTAAAALALGGGQGRLGAGAGTGAIGSESAVSPALLAEMAALRARQTGYLSALSSK